jgi:riboflavin kinase
MLRMKLSFREIKSSILPTLLELLYLGAKDKPIEISTSELGKRLGKSQQSISKHLIELQKLGLIEVTYRKRKSVIKLTENGVSILLSLYATLREIFEEAPNVIEFTGTVFSGLGEGSYYVTIEGYRQQFIKKLGFDPYPGTLNVRLTSAVEKCQRKDLEYYSGILIEGFNDEYRTYGGAKCFPAIINDTVEGAIVLTKRSLYDESVLEVIAPVNLRNRLNLKDGDKIRLKVYISERSINSKSGL